MGKDSAEVARKRVPEQFGYFLNVIAEYPTAPSAQDNYLMSVRRGDCQNFANPSVHRITDFLAPPAIVLKYT